MNTILKFQDHNRGFEIAAELIDSIINPKLNESSRDNQIYKILHSFAKDLKFNKNIVETFETGVENIFPIVEKLIRNSSLKVEITYENIVLLTIATLSVVYLEENNNAEGSAEILCPSCSGKNNKGCKNCGGGGKITSIVTKEDARTLNEELKLRGIGNGIVKKMVNCVRSILNLMQTILSTRPTIDDLCCDDKKITQALGAVLSMIEKNNFTIDNLAQNLVGVSVGASSLLSVDPVDTKSSSLKRSTDINDGDYKNLGKNKLIKEQ